MSPLADLYISLANSFGVFDVNSHVDEVECCSLAGTSGKLKWESIATAAERAQVVRTGG